MKIGIITHYYKSCNYGGNLQAFALVMALRNNGFDAEQITYDLKIDSVKVSAWNSVSKNPLVLVRRMLGKLKRFYCKNVVYKKFGDINQKKERAFSDFNKKTIPHSEKVYDESNIAESVNEYDAFVTGSDQVWNFTWYRPEFFLDFVPSNKIKISYAASMAMTTLTEAQQEIVKESLKDFKKISVREERTIDLISDLVPVPPCLTLDPTLLLDSCDWDAVATKRLVEKEYVFCYFLGENRKSRKLAEQYARKHNLTLVTIPHASGVKFEDIYFAKNGVKIIDASPTDFVSLIKNSKIVLTDSFHAVVFSNIYKKQYVVFNRSKHAEMSSRIFDITELFHQEDRFCYDSSRENLRYINSLSNIDYETINEEFEKAKQESIEFLKQSLKD